MTEMRYDNFLEDTAGVPTFVHTYIDPRENEIVDSRRIRVHGDIVNDVYVRLDLGRKYAYDLVETIRDSLRDTTIGGLVHTRGARVENGRIIDDWYMVRVRTRFWADDYLASSDRGGADGSRDNVVDSFFSAVDDFIDVPCGYPNFEFEPPDDTAFAVASVVQGDEDRTENPASTRTYGVAYLMIGAPLDSGTYELDRIWQDFYDHFKATRHYGVTFHAPSLARVGRSGAWWQVTARCPFTSYLSE